MGRMGEEKWRKWGEWDEVPIFHSPIFPIFPGVEDLPHSSLCKNQVTALTDGKLGFLPLTATHCHGGQCGCLAIVRGPTQRRGPVCTDLFFWLRPR